MRTVLILTLSIALTSCNLDEKKSDKVWSDLPEITELGNLKQTDFAITLENPIDTNKNVIYAPAFLYVWDKIKGELQSPVVVDNSNSLDFKLLNQSNTYLNSLAETEYTATAEVSDGAIIAKAFFNKSLPFETKMQKIDKPINFKNSKVSAFGMTYFEGSIATLAQVLYYKDDNNFVLKLQPKDQQNEIILTKGLYNFQTLKEAIDKTNVSITKGKQEKLDLKQAWKYEISDEDIFEIPIIQFNIATHYKNLEGQAFKTKDMKNHNIQEAYQRTGFILNENGAVVESEAYAVVDSAGAEPIIKHPKKMIFDKPFLIIIKRADKQNPYFVMKISNTELMIKK